MFIRPVDTREKCTWSALKSSILEIYSGKLKRSNRFSRTWNMKSGFCMKSHKVSKLLFQIFFLLFAGIIMIFRLPTEIR